MIHKFPFKILSLLLAIGLLAFALYPRIETGKLWYDIVGVDVSHYQGQIDWRRLRQAGVSFAYIKATEGGDFVDPKFRDNWNGSLQADIATGAYHFFTQCKSGAEQAANFIATVPLDERSLPPVVDVEQLDCGGKPSTLNPVEEIKVFLKAAEVHYGCRPIIYTTPDFESMFLQGKMLDEIFWPRSIFWPPTYRKENWVYWQYHHYGRRDGIEGPVDLDAFRGTDQDFQKFRNAQHCGTSRAN